MAELCRVVHERAALLVDGQQVVSRGVQRAHGVAMASHHGQLGWRQLREVWVQETESSEEGTSYVGLRWGIFTCSGVQSNSSRMEASAPSRRSSVTVVERPFSAA
jgi:hypothetical protein